MIAFGTVLLTTIVGSVAVFQVMGPIADLLIATGGNEDMLSDPQIQATFQAQITAQFPLQAALLNLSTPIGFGAWILGIVATAMNRGRMWGVFAIILGVLAPIILVIVAVLGLGPAFAALQ